MLLIDYHSHLLSSEIIGFLGGYWDPLKKHIKIVAAFPAQSCGDDRFNVEIDPISQLEVTQKIQKQNMQVVGWYHSHTTFVPDPSVRDIENQTNFQLLYHCEKSSMHPFIGIINTTYDTGLPSAQSVTNCFWIFNGNPMKVVFGMNTESDISKHVKNEMRNLIDVYKDHKRRINWGRTWKGGQKNLKLTFMEKFKESLLHRLPSNCDKEEGKKEITKYLALIGTNWKPHKK
uniref:MPN domain-containing protein n=1 Tax=Arcella intermedia TaxID=1963864 RepID=A0A6B2LEF3_9EUKA